MSERLSFQDIPQFPRASYEIDVAWEWTERQLARWQEDYRCDLSPDYQRGHVWTEEQQQAFVEYLLQGGEVGKAIVWNCEEWDTMPGPGAKMELVDGKQRLEATRKFMRNELRAFGQLRSEFAGRMRWHVTGLKWRVCSLDRAGVLRFYLSLNGGGTPHTAEELERVRALLAQADSGHHRTNTNTLSREMRSAESRLDALERRPPVVTVTLQQPPPASKPGKAGAK